MKAKDNEYRNFIDYPYNDACGACGAMVGADGSEDIVEEKDLGGKMKNLVVGGIFLVGVVVTATWAYKKWIK